MKKKLSLFLALLLAVSLCLGLSVGASAAGVTTVTIPVGSYVRALVDLPGGETLREFEILDGEAAPGMTLRAEGEGLALVGKLVESKEMKDKVETCRNLLIDGDNFPEALEKSKIFSSFYSQMVYVGFKTGSMDAAMKQIAERFEHETERKIFTIISVLEPTLVIVLSVIVGMILLSVILPLMGIMSTIG
jgi:hypothetical protein